MVRSVKTSFRHYLLLGMLTTIIGFTLPAASQTLSGVNQTKLLQLSEVLGGVHHLRALCVQSEAQTWRQSMIRLIETQEAPKWLADRMIERFNQGYYREQSAYPVCDASSQRRAVRLANEGARLSRALARN